MRESEFLAAMHSDRGAENATSIFEHKIDILGSDFLGGDDQIAFILAIFIIDYDDELTITEIFKSFLDAIKFDND